MIDGPPAQSLTHTVKFRLSASDHAHLVRQAEVHRVRINELARQLVLDKSRRHMERPTLDPAIVIQMQDIGLQLRQMLADGGCAPGLCARIAELCWKIESFINEAIAMEDSSWSP